MELFSPAWLNPSFRRRGGGVFETVALLVPPHPFLCCGNPHLQQNLLAGILVGSMEGACLVAPGIQLRGMFCEHLVWEFCLFVFNLTHTPANHVLPASTRITLARVQEKPGNWPKIKWMNSACPLHYGFFVGYSWLLLSLRKRLGRRSLSNYPGPRGDKWVEKVIASRHRWGQCKFCWGWDFFFFS